jgi:hypothetical protein
MPAASWTSNRSDRGFLMVEVTSRSGRVTHRRLGRGGARWAIMVASLLATSVFAAWPAAAQTAAACTYRACALTIAPTWNGLAVVRASSGERVANLHFFWPHDVTPALAGVDAGAVGADSAAAYARDAVRLRRVGAIFTDAGIVLAAGAAASALRHGRLSRDGGVLAGIGAASLAVSVPFQFAADGALSRAVWWHNLRFGR